MSVRKCMFPWHLALVTVDGHVLPCCHGGKVVGDLNKQSFDEIWNGQALQDVRQHILADKVHPICQSSECPFQTEHPAIAVRKNPLSLTEKFAREFDEKWYLQNYPEARRSVREHRSVSGLDHYLLDGIDEGKTYRLRRPSLWQKTKTFLQGNSDTTGFSEGKQGVESGEPATNAILALLEFSRGATVVRNKPVDVVFALTTRCNLSCVMCPQGVGLVKEPKHMPESLIDALGDPIDRAAKMVADGAGEPTLSPAFWALITKIRDRTDLYCRTNSNGHLITPDKAERLVESGLSEISISLDAATPETYRKIRGGDLNKAVRGISNLVEARKRRPESELKIYVNMTLMRTNIEEIVGFVSLCKDLGVDAADISQLFSFGDKPEWKARRDGFEFVYSDQMIGQDPDKARSCISAAKKASEQNGLVVNFTNKTDHYLIHEQQTDR